MLPGFPGLPADPVSYTHLDVYKRQELSLDTGSVNPEKTMPVFLEKLKQAGSQVIIDEVQKQIDEWKAAK